jgi:PhnB protein
MKIEPYLIFEGRAQEAITFYQKAVKAEIVMLMHFKDSPDQSMISPDSKDKVMHAAIRIGESTVLLSDGQCMSKSNFEGFSLTITAANDAEAERVFAALGDGGQVRMPMATTFFASRFGMLADRFGVSWMVIVPTMHA